MDEKPVSDDYIRKCRDLTGHPDAMLGMRSQEARSLLDEVAARRRAAPALDAELAILRELASAIDWNLSAWTARSLGGLDSMDKALDAYRGRAKAAAGQTKPQCDLPDCHGGTFCEQPAAPAREQVAEGGTPEERALEQQVRYFIGLVPGLPNTKQLDSWVATVMGLARAAVAAEKAKYDALHDQRHEEARRADAAEAEVERLKLECNQAQRDRRAEHDARVALAGEVESMRERTPAPHSAEGSFVRIDPAEISRMQDEIATLRDHNTRLAKAAEELAQAPATRGAEWLAAADTLAAAALRWHDQDSRHWYDGCATCQSETVDLISAIEALRALATPAAPAQRAEAGEADWEIPLRMLREALMAMGKDWPADTRSPAVVWRDEALPRIRMLRSDLILAESKAKACEVLHGLAARSAGRDGRAGG